MTRHVDIICSGGWRLFACSREHSCLRSCHQRCRGIFPVSIQFILKMLGKALQLPLVMSSQGPGLALPSWYKYYLCQADCSCDWHASPLLQKLCNVLQGTAYMSTCQPSGIITESCVYGCRASGILVETCICGMQWLGAQTRDIDRRYWQSLSANVLSIDFAPSIAQLVMGHHESFAVRCL